MIDKNMFKTHLLDYFEDTVENKSNLIAVRHNTKKITFGTLNDCAEKLGTYILSYVNEEMNKPIAVFLPKEIVENGNCLAGSGTIILQFL